MASLLRAKRVGWGLVFGLAQVVAVLSYLSGSRYMAAVREVEHTLYVESAIDGTLSLLKDAETGQRGYILSGDPQFLQPYEAARRDIPPLFERLQAAVQDDTEKITRVAVLERLIQNKYEFIDTTISLHRAGDTVQATQLIRSGRGKQLMDAIRNDCHFLLELEERDLVKRKHEAESARLGAIWAVGLGVALTILLALFSLITVDRDVRELRRAADALAKRERYYRLLTEQGSDLVRLLGLDGVCSYVSPSVERLLGYTVAEYLALPGLSLMHPDEVGIGRQILTEAKSGKVGDGLSTYRIKNKAGEFRWFEVRWALIRDEEGAPRELHTAGRDVTERRNAERQLRSYAEEVRKASLLDELTGLYNRRGFLEIAGELHDRASSARREAALVYADLNGMKWINDELGHDTGDEALKDAAHVLTAALGDGPVVARLGGDELVAFALDFGQAELDGLRVRLRELADARMAELKREFRLSFSVGGAFMTVGSRLALAELIDRADAEMYTQKNARRAANNTSVPPPPKPS
jgi:diguanylate cyclase (GGDEF)-like protein/PAS domain S-box-containing protein